MNATFDQLREIFLDALENRPPDQWEAFLDQACSGDLELRRQVGLLLKAHAAERSLSDVCLPGFGESAAYVPIIEGPGAVVGPYKLLEQIGEGGMGVVYVAEQSHPVHRRVALKIIKPGMDTKQVVARFEAERQALAMMDHPNIAKVHDAGATAFGRPYFAMELVRGIQITDYCDREQLSIPDRLKLFVLVCRAVQHAHQKGIIHRDLKPSNILVTMVDGVGVPKVIDFGVAKATGHALTDRTIYTACHQLIGSPLYMSPEQADLSGMDIDTRSDIYSLGVLLYELLTGTTPFDPATFSNVPFDEVRRIIREDEPPRPSSRLSSLSAKRTTVSADRSSGASQLDRSVRGELDWIVMKALDKHRQRRYDTANDFAADVIRCLTDQPVTACPPTAGYRLRKFSRRNRAGLTTAALVAITLIAGTAVSLWQAVRATRAELQAKDDFRRGRDAVDRIFTKVAEDLAEAPGMEQVRRALLEDALAFYEQFLSAHGDDSDVKHEAARASYRVGSIYFGLGHFDRVEKPVRQAAKLLEYLIGASPTEPRYRLDLADCHALLARLYAWSHMRDQDVAERRMALDQHRKIAADHPGVPAYLRKLASSHGNLGVGLSAAGAKQFDEAERHFREALKIWERLQSDFPGLTEDRAGLAHLYQWLGNLHLETRHWSEAERELRRSLALREDLLAIGPATPSLKLDLSHIKLYLAELKFQQGKLDECERLNRETIAHVEPLSRDYPNTIEYRRRLASGYRGLGLSLWAMGRTREAEDALRVVLAIRTNLAGEHPGVQPFAENLASIYSYLGQFLEEAGRPEESADAFRRSLAIYEALAAERPVVAGIQAELAWFLATCQTPQFRDAARAVQLARKALQLDPSSGTYWRVLGAAQYRQGDWPAATVALTRAVDLEPADRAAGLFLAMAHWRQGEKEQARSWHERAIVAINDRWSADMQVRQFRAEAKALLQIEDVEATMPNGPAAFARIPP